MNARLVARLLVAIGLLTVGTGFYLMALRQPLLPEDVRFAGLDPSAVPPGLLRWLEIVIRTWGGFVLGFGVSLAGYGAFLATGRPVWVRCGVALARVVSFGVFLVSNWMLQLDFLWPIAVLFLLALATAIGLVSGRKDR
jgi:hypothetical protein